MGSRFRPEPAQRTTICGDLCFLRTGASRNGIPKTSRKAFAHHSTPIPPEVTGHEAGVCIQLSKGTDHGVSLALLLEGIDLALE